MPLVIPAGYAECSFIHRNNGTLQPAVCTLAVDTDDFAELNTVGDKWRDLMLAEMNNSFTYVGFSARVTAGTSVTTSYNTAGAGGGSGTSPQVSYLYRKNTIHPGREGHGRMYYPGCDETSVGSEGQVASGKVTGLNNQIAAFRAALALIGGGVSIYLLHNSATAPYAISTMSAETVVATQRRRLKR